MDIWKAALFLVIDEYCQLQIKFRFEKENGKYRANPFFLNDEWINTDSKWSLRRIPKKMTVRKSYSTLIVEQGFDRELDSTELKELENNMKWFMRRYLLKEKEETVREYDKKIKIIELDL